MSLQSHKGQILPLKNRVIPVDSNTMFLAHYDLNENDVLRGIAPTVTTPIFTLRPDGKFGGGIAVDDSTTNLMLTPDFSANFSSYTDFTATVFDEPLSFTGRALAFRAADVGSINSAGRVSVVSSVSTGTHTFSIYLKGEGATIGKIPRVYTGVWNVHTELLTGEYKRFVFPNVAVTQVNIGIGLSGGFANSESVYMHSPQLETKVFPTSFTTGSRGSGVLAYDMNQLGVAPTGDWTISGWYKRTPGVPLGAAPWCGLFNMGNYYTLGQSEFQIWTNHTTSPYLKAWSHDNQVGRSKSLFVPNTGELEDWFFVAVTHTAATDTYAFYIWTKDRYFKDSWTVIHANPITPILYVGGSPQRFNGTIDEFRIDNIARTEDEITAWYHSNSPFYPKGIYRVGY